MKKVDLILIPRWIITVNRNQAVLENHALVINNGVIEAICPAADVESHYSASQIKKLNEHAVAPGFINSHTHLAMNLLRGLADDLKLMDWLQNHIWPTEKKWLGEDFVAVGSRLAMAEMLKNGITCFNDMYFFPEVIAQVALDVGMRACIGLTVMDLPTAYAKTAEEYLVKGVQVYNSYQQQELINFTFAPHSVYTVSDAILSRVAASAKEMGLVINIHAHETADEINQSLAKTQKRPLRRLLELGFPLEKTLLIHMTQIDADDWDVLRQYKTNIVHCPESNMKLASGYCPVQDFLNAGINVALGTDGVASNNDLDMFGEMRAASYLAKFMKQDPQALPAAQTLELATINGARALHLDSVIGSLEVGKAADCIAINLNSVQTIPVYHPVSQLVYAANPQNISDVWVAGKQLVDNHQLTTIDENQLKNDVDGWYRKIIS